MSKGSQVTAFALDESVAAAAEGVNLAGVPGVWQPGVAVLPSALGLTLAEMRSLISELGLPLTEVRAGEADALAEFPADEGQLPSAVEGTLAATVEAAHEQADAEAAAEPEPEPEG